jgi:hypothetical protein
MPRRPTDDGMRYMRWLEGMWETHKLDLGYPNARREEERKEEVLRMLRGLGELSEELGAAEAPSFPPPEPGR